MKINDKAELKQFTSRHWWYTSRGIAMIILGGGIALLCLVAPNVYMLGESFSWIPVIGVVVIFVGIFRCLDAFSTVTAQGFLVNMQGGVLDVVVGTLVLFSINFEADNLNLLIVGYMISQGIYRNILLTVAKVVNPLSNRVTGVISIVLGMLIWVDWPTSASWFLAFSLSIDISFRGWALMVLASVLKKEEAVDKSI